MCQSIIKTKAWLTALLLMVCMGHSCAHAAKALAGKPTAKENDAESREDIAEVMRQAMESGLILQVIRNQATYDQVLYLAALLERLDDVDPPEGTREDWKSRTRALQKAVEDVRSEKKDSRKRLQQAANCASCHKAHRTDHSRTFSEPLPTL